MRALRKVRLRLRSLFRTRHVERELDDELRFHLEREIAERRAAGLSPDEARVAAWRSLGGAEQVKEACRDTRRVAVFTHLVQDLRHGTRLLRAQPGFAAATILTIALGIAASTAIFSIVYGIALRPLPFGEPERLVAVWRTAAARAERRMNVSGALHRDWREQNHVFEDVALVRSIANFNLTGGQEPERISAARVSANLFDVLRVRPLLGRTFQPGEDAIGRENVVILGHAIWQRRYQADPGILGTSILLSGTPHTVVGVMGPDFVFPAREFALWVPLTLNPEELRTRIGNNFQSVARLKPGVTIAQAEADMQTILTGLARQYPNSYSGLGVSYHGLGVEVVPLLDSTVEPVRNALYMMLGAVGCLLLIGCASLANLLLARALGRGRELVVRAALGASRGRLLRQSLTELLPMLALGGALGVTGAFWIVRTLVPWLPAQVPRVEAIAVNGPVLAFSAAVLGLTGLLAGLLPALHAAGTDLAASLREASRTTAGGRGRTRVRSVLVVGQVAAAILLLVGASLLVRSFTRLARVDPGFRTDRAISLLLAIPRTKYTSDPDIAAFSHRVVDRVKALPGVAAAGMVNRMPLSEGAVQTGGLQLEGSRLPNGVIEDTDWRSATPDYFGAMGIPLIRGRLFTDADTHTTTPVGLVDERLARVAWPDEDPIGKRFRIPFPGLPWIRIVGVVGHIRHDGLDRDPRPQVYWPLRQRGQDRMALIVRTQQDPRTLTPSIVAAIRAEDPEQAVYDVRTLEQLVTQWLAPRWLNMALLVVFAGFSLLLATLGLYGVIAYAAGQRVREFGVRMALGAERRDIVRLVVRQGAALAGAGALIGLASALLLSRLLESLLYEVDARDGWSFGGATAILLGVALLASYLPARRAARRDPTQALRAE